MRAYIGMAGFFFCLEVMMHKEWPFSQGLVSAAVVQTVLLSLAEAAIFYWLIRYFGSTTSDRGQAESTADRNGRDVVEHAEEEQPHDPLMRKMKKYDITLSDGKYGYMGILYSTFEYALAAAKRNRGDS
jgi:hypothetical protein